MNSPVVGVLALQGGVAEHIRMLESLGARTVKVRATEDLLTETGELRVDALVLPGGESSTMDRLCRTFGLTGPLRQVIGTGLPVLGTCAGLIMLASEIQDPAPGQQSLGVLDVSVSRNAFGSQVDSAEVTVHWGKNGGTVRAAFIRAPEITRVGHGVEVLARRNGAVVAARQGNVLGISFHPELTEDQTVHKLLLSLCRFSAYSQVR